MDEFDLVVIGAGSGLDVANAAVNEGQSVAIVEKGPLGGTCLNRGCIPSKHLLYHADVLETVERAGEYHVDATVNAVDVPAIVRDVNDDVAEDAAGIRDGLESSPDHALFDGTGEFVGDRTLELVEGEDEGARLRGEAVVIAAGTRPSVPDVDGLDAVDYLTSREALQLETPPEHLLIVGGGYVAAELAHFFGTFGSEVTIVGRRPALLPAADPEVAEAFTDRYADRFTVHTGYTATAVSQADGEITLEAQPYGDEGGGKGEVDEDGDEDDDSGAEDENEHENGGGDDSGEGDTDDDPVSATGDALLVAAGRRPNTDTLAVEETGVETDDCGFVEVDEYLRTTAEDVWALGDVVGDPQLKHTANREARVVARNLYGDELEPMEYDVMPWAVFSSPEVAGVGATEDELREDDREYATNTYRYDETARGDAMHADGFAKVLVDLEGEILGFHLIGPDASTLVHEVVVAMEAGSGIVADIRESVHVHPALPEVVQRAFTGQFTRRDSGQHDHHGEHSHSEDHDHHGHEHDDQEQRGPEHTDQEQHDREH